MHEIDLTASVVLYKTNENELGNLLKCFSSTTLKYHIYLIDNSPTDILKKYSACPNVTYHYNAANLGFGAGHNIAINKVLNKSKYHLVINADVWFKNDLLEELVYFMNVNNKFAHLMPKVLYPDGSIQYLCRNKPTLQYIFLKRLIPQFLKKKFSHYLDNYEYRQKDYNNFFYDVPFLSGCFMLFRTEILADVKGFNESIFLYFEDADITQKILTKYHNVYYPANFIYHSYKGTKYNLRLALSAANGLYKYFKIWGFFG